MELKKTIRTRQKPDILDSDSSEVMHVRYSSQIICVYSWKKITVHFFKQLGGE